VASTLPFVSPATRTLRHRRPARGDRAEGQRAGERRLPAGPAMMAPLWLWNSALCST